MKNEAVIPHLFRMEYRKIVAVLSKRFGFEQIEIAEDIASDTFLTATQTWGMNGLPENPVAWLYSVAKNKARNHLQRNTVFEHKIAPELKSNAAILIGTGYRFITKKYYRQPAANDVCDLSSFHFPGSTNRAITAHSMRFWNRRNRRCLSYKQGNDQ